MQKMPNSPHYTGVIPTDVRGYSSKRFIPRLNWDQSECPDEARFQESLPRLVKLLTPSDSRFSNAKHIPCKPFCLHRSKTSRLEYFGMIWTLDNCPKPAYPTIFSEGNISLEKNALVLKVKEIPANKEFINVHNMYQIHFLNKWKKETTSERLFAEKKLYSAAFLRSATPVSYGYFEILCKLGNSILSSSISLKEEGGTGREITIFNYSNSSKTYRGLPFQKYFLTNIQSQGKKDSNNAKSSCFESPKAIYVYRNLCEEPLVKVGFLWTDKTLYWLLNNNIVREVDHNGLFKDVKLHIYFSRQYFSWVGEPDNSDPKGDFKIFGFRKWKLN